jgi:DNA repair protein RecN (Recombination protein N)
MLDELDIRDFVLAEHLRLHFDRGFTAITGETGAGKSLVVDALGVLLGDRPPTDIVRTGAAVARLEGTFVLQSNDEELDAILAESGIEPEDGLLIVSRELPRGGRASARINGRAVLQSTLAAVGSRLVDIHSQTEHLAILRPVEHVNYIDRFAGALGERSALGAGVAELRRVRAEIARLQEDARERARRQERLSYEIQEIESARIAPEEEDELRRERSRLANAEQLAQLATQAYAALEGDGETPGAVDALGTAAELLDQLARLDENLAGEAAQLEALQSQAAEVARTLRAYSEDVEYNPQRLQQIEDRLALLSGLKRKYGATLDEVLAYAAAAEAELEELSTSEERAEALRAEEAELVRRLGAASRALSERRRAAAARLCGAVERQLADLGLAAGRFGVRFDVRADPAGVPVELPSVTVTAEGEEDVSEPVSSAAIERTGVDRVELLVSLNRGEPLRPLARVASGGETSRLMLALKTVLGEADSVPTLVFDEVDVGVGGRSGRIVGEKLSGLAAHHQVICITHLPQIASLAAEHLTIEKQVERREEGERTVVRARELRGEERLEEVAAMLGGATAATRASARELLGDTQC